MVKARLLMWLELRANAVVGGRGVGRPGLHGRCCWGRVVLLRERCAAAQGTRGSSCRRRVMRFLSGDMQRSWLLRGWGSRAEVDCLDHEYY